ncbi:hypothetical protein SNOG_07955 [Parastagonospora nodorum SN15]|uniref:Uncharacterized protein n=1 Tax=Phaeosphaeria nodorum (strain SN15 / ATCC MYA-4574 / FGSC 10173) TaxID=321614 RepID=Q0UJV9_PHANO|nr:hypothetical protein SNOG_07955 [Parastagonospora nodorum SN15]EAT84231.1 hypothetical protein SNOG_07955 [Parastagonospora nodorum SN15]
MARRGTWGLLGKLPMTIATAHRSREAPLLTQRDGVFNTEL